MSKITGRLLVRREKDTEYRFWGELTKEEKENISKCLIRDAAHGGGFKERT